jgi:hypothetical protein
MMKMTPDQKNQTIKILETLMYAHLDRIAIYDLALDKSERLDPSLRVFLSNMIANSQALTGELEEEIGVLKVNATPRTIAPVRFRATFLRTFAGSAFRREPGILLLLCRFIEGRLLKAYEKAFGSYSISLKVRRLVLRHERLVADGSKMMQVYINAYEQRRRVYASAVRCL